MKIKIPEKYEEESYIKGFNLGWGRAIAATIKFFGLLNDQKENFVETMNSIRNNIEPMKRNQIDQGRD